MKNRAKQVGKENRTNVLNRLGLKPAPISSISYVMIDGVPHKMKDGVLVPMTKIVQIELIGKQALNEFCNNWKKS